MLKKISVIVFLSFSLHASFLRIAVAANVSYALPALNAEFAKMYPDVNIQSSLASSGKLTAQIRHGANYELFLSANMKYPKALYFDGLALSKPSVYAQGALVLLSSSRRDFSKGMELLSEKNIHKIAIANPKTAPYGKAAKQALQSAKLYEKLKHKLVFAQNVSATVSYALNAADIGLVAKSTLFSPKMQKYKHSIHWMDVDNKLYTPIEQGVVLLKPAQNKPIAKAFYEFILSEKAKQIFLKFGYNVP